MDNRKIKRDKAITWCIQQFQMFNAISEKAEIARFELEVANRYDVSLKSAKEYVKIARLRWELSTRKEPEENMQLNRS